MLNSKLLILYKLVNRPLLANRIQIRTANNLGRKSQEVYKIDDVRFDEIRVKYFANRSELSKVEWHGLRETLMNKFRHINRNNLDATIIQLCKKFDEFDLAKNYIKYLKDNNQPPNAGTLGKLLRLYNTKYHKRGASINALNANEHEEILHICNELKREHNILDSLTCENIIFGLVTTDKWRDSLPLLEMIRLTSAPSLAVYTELALKAFAMHDIDLGCSICEQMLHNNLQPKPEILHDYLKAIMMMTLHSENCQYHLEKFLHFLQRHNLIITEDVVNVIENIAQTHPNLLIMNRSHLSSSGRCSVCSLYMANARVSDEDYRKLSKCFMEKVLVGNDIFQKTTPQEMEAFMNYIARTAPYDCVIDGLNVAYSLGNKKTAKQIADLLVVVVKHFVEQGKHVLVLGRQHMNKWPRNTIQYIKSNASMFLTNNLSQDDPFLLYATLKSGKFTDFFSRDLMRQHAYLLGNDLKSIFRRWQQLHQYSLIKQTKTGRIIIKKPIRYLLCTHQLEEGYWHLPYKMEYSVHVNEHIEIPEQWLCLKFLKTT